MHAVGFRAHWQLGGRCFFLELPARPISCKVLRASCGRLVRMGSQAIVWQALPRRRRGALATAIQSGGGADLLRRRGPVQSGSRWGPSWISMVVATVCGRRLTVWGSPLKVGTGQGVVHGYGKKWPSRPILRWSMDVGVVRGRYRGCSISTRHRCTRLHPMNTPVIGDAQEGHDAKRRRRVSRGRQRFSP